MIFTKQQVTRWPNLVPYFDSPITPCEHSLLCGDFLRVNMPWVTMHLLQIQEPYTATGQIGLLHWYAVEGEFVHELFFLVSLL